MNGNGTELIILGSTKTGDNSLVIHTLSEEYGRRGFLVTVGKTIKMSAFMPLSIIEAEITENRKSTLWKASKCSSVFPLMGIRGNIYKNSISLFICEVLFRTIHDGAREEGLYEWCRSTILTLDAMESDFSNFHLRFLLDLAASLGFRPELNDLMPFCKNDFEDMSRLLALSFEESMFLPLNGQRRRQLCDSLIRYLSHHTDTRLTINSLDVLSELLK